MSSKNEVYVTKKLNTLNSCQRQLFCDILMIPRESIDIEIRECCRDIDKLFGPTAIPSKLALLSRRLGYKISISDLV